MAHEAPTGPRPPASRAFDAAIEAADAGTLAAATVAGLAAELCQIQASQPVAKHGRAEAELAGRCRPLAEEAAKALAAVSSARGELEAAASAAAARVGELQSALDARGAEERRAREHAAAVHAQRVALMGQLEAEREQRAAAEQAAATLLLCGPPLSPSSLSSLPPLLFLPSPCFLLLLHSPVSCPAQASGAAVAEAEALKKELSGVRCELEEAQSSRRLLCLLFVCDRSFLRLGPVVPRPPLRRQKVSPAASLTKS